MAHTVTTEAVRIELGRVVVDGDLRLPERSAGLVVFAHGSGSSRFSRRNRAVAKVLEHAGFGTLLLDLLTRKEEAEDQRTAEHRFNIPLLGARVVAAVDWAEARSDLHSLPVAFFGASTGAAAALIAAADRPQRTRAVISRGGRPDLAEDALSRVEAPTLLIVGGDDTPVIDMNREAMRRMRAPCPWRSSRARPICLKSRERSNRSRDSPRIGAAGISRHACSTGAQEIPCHMKRQTGHSASSTSGGQVSALLAT